MSEGKTKWVETVCRATFLMIDYVMPHSWGDSWWRWQRWKWWPGHINGVVKLVSLSVALTRLCNAWFLQIYIKFKECLRKWKFLVVMSRAPSGLRQFGRLLCNKFQWGTCEQMSTFDGKYIFTKKMASIGQRYAPSNWYDDMKILLFEEPCRILMRFVQACVVNVIHAKALPGSVLYFDHWIKVKMWKWFINVYRQHCPESEKSDKVACCCCWVYRRPG